MVTRQDQSQDFSTAEKALVGKPAPIADVRPGGAEVRFVTSHRAAKLSQPAYAAERRRRLMQIFRGVETRVRNGWSITGALRAAARRWKGRTFKSAPGREVDFSLDTLARIFWRYRKIGEAALTLHYVAPARKEVSPIVTEELLQRAGNSDIKSFSALFRSVCNDSENPLPSRRTIVRAIPENKRQAVSKLMRARRSASAAQKKAARQAEREIKRAEAELEKAERAAAKILEAAK